MIFYTFLLFHLFINSSQEDNLYVTGILIYLANLIISKKNYTKTFEDMLFIVIITPLTLLFGWVKQASILADYIFFLLLLGTIIQYISLLKQEKAQNEKIY